MVCYNPPLQISLVDYLNAERTHFDANNERLGSLVTYVDRVSDLWLGSIELGEAKLDSVAAISSTLSIAIHERMLAFTSHYMRSRLQDAFTSLRQGIDCTLTLLALILEDTRLAEYIERERDFRRIKEHIKKRLKDLNTLSEFQVKIVENLIAVHELTSQLAAHADIDTVVFRRIVKNVESDAKSYEYRYFQWDDDDRSYKFFFVGSLLRFLLMLQIVAMRKECHIGVTDEWQIKTSQLGNELETMFLQYKPESKE